MTHSLLAPLSATFGVIDELSRPLAPLDTTAGVIRAIVLVNALFAIAAWGMGRFARATRLNARYLQEVAELQRREAVRSERTAIARELHDVVSHAVAVMMLQASVARRMLPSDPERASTSLGHVEDAGTQAMSELRTMLDVLRAVDGPDELVTADAALADLRPLFETVRRAGLIVTEHRAGEPRPVERGIELAAVRIVQEALTNATKHAGPGSRVHVVVTWTSGGLILSITDDGGGLPAQTTGLSAGMGLIGLRERASSVGGSVRAGSTPQGGFEVVAELPVAAAVATPGQPTPVT